MNLPRVPLHRKIVKRKLKHREENMPKTQTSTAMTSLPKPCKKYTVLAIISVCRYFGWRELLVRIKLRQDYLTEFNAMRVDSVVYRAWCAHQIEYWCGGSMDEKYIADLRVRMSLCRQLGHSVVENINEVYQIGRAHV